MSGQIQDVFSFAHAAGKITFSLGGRTVTSVPVEELAAKNAKDAKVARERVKPKGHKGHKAMRPRRTVCSSPKTRNFVLSFTLLTGAVPLWRWALVSLWLNSPRLLGVLGGSHRRFEYERIIDDHHTTTLWFGKLQPAHFAHHAALDVDVVHGRIFERRAHH